jgi:hypothetical protein
MLKDEGEGEECNVLFAVSDVANFRISAQGQKSKTVFQPLDFLVCTPQLDRLSSAQLNPSLFL